MSELTLQRWERQFRRDAKADRLAALRVHVQRLDLRARPELCLEGTIRVVRACAAYMELDGQPYAPFLTMQTYDPLRSPRAEYAFTFSIWDKAFARVLVARDLRGLDLADLYSHPWDDYKVCGFHELWVTRTDQAALKKRESARLERQVNNDLRFDYTEEELEVSFDNSYTAGALYVFVQDRPDEDEE